MLKPLQKIVFYEHEKKPIKCSEFCFSEREMNLLEQVNRIQGCEFFKLLHKDIRATQYVGFMRVGRKDMQVVPKIFKDNVDANLHFLLYLLKYTQKIDLKYVSQIHLDKYQDDFFEIMIGLFARNANELLQHDLKRNYVAQEQSCQYLRGKLLICEQIRRGIVNRSRLFCRYDEFTENNRLNKTLKYVSSLLLNISKNHANRKLLHHNLLILAEVDDQVVTLADIDKIHFTRLNYEYRPLIELCRLFLSNMAISLQLSRLETFSFMFDMNRLFEDFVFQFLSCHKSKLGLKIVKGQRCLGKLFGEFNMYYDILIENEQGVEVLIDTKYKLPAVDKRHYGLSQADFYQMFAYSQSQTKKYPKVVLLYPKCEMPENNFQHIHELMQIDLGVRCIDLQKIWDCDKRRLNEDYLIEDLRRCFPYKAAIR